MPDELRALGHEAVAPDLPCDDDGATFDDYAQVVLDALEGADDDVVVVGYSLGGLTAPLVAARRRVRELVHLAALLPEPGASLDDQLRRGARQLLPDYAAGIERHGFGSRWVDFDVYHRVACHDCPEPAARERFDRSRPQSMRPYGDPFPLDAMPAIPTRYVMCAEERLLDNDFLGAAVRERLGIEPIELPGSHSPMASRPAELARRLAEVTPSARS